MSKCYDIEEIVDRNHAANVAKLNQLVLDAKNKSDSCGEKQPLNFHYWGGFAEGIERALSVIEGKG